MDMLRSVGERILANAAGMQGYFEVILGAALAALVALVGYTWQQRKAAERERLWFKRIRSASDRHFNSFLEVYEENRSAQEEWWDPPQVFAEWVETCYLHVAIRNEQVLGYVFYSFLEESRYAVIWYIGSVRGEERDIALQLLTHVRTQMPRNCEGILYECISPGSSSPEKERQALARIQLFLSLARQLGELGKHPWYALHLDVNYKQPLLPDEYAPENEGEEKVLDLYFIPLKDHDPEPKKYLPREKVEAIVRLMYEEYRLSYAGEEATKHGQPYADYVSVLERAAIENLPEQVVCKHARRKTVGGYSKSRADF